MPEGGAVLAVAEDVLDRGAVPVPVLRLHRFAGRGHVQVRQYERVAVDRTGAGQLGERQGTLIRVQGPAPPRPRVGGNLLRVQPDPADQQPGVRGPPVRAVVSHDDLRAVHAGRIMPVAFGDAAQQPPQRRDPLRPDRERDVLVVGGAGQLPGEVPGVGAQRHPAASPRCRGQAGQRAAQQTRRGCAHVVGARAQVGGQHDLGLGPGRHVRAAHPLPLVVIGHPALLAAVHLHVRGIQVDGHRPSGQRRGTFRWQQRHHPDGDRRQAGLHRPPLRGSDPPGQARGGRRGQPGHRRQLLPRGIGALAIQPGQEVLPCQLRRRDPGQQLPCAEAAVPLLDRPGRGVDRPDNLQPPAQLTDGSHPRIRRQRRIRRADPCLPPRPSPAAYPGHQIGVLSA